MKNTIKEVKISLDGLDRFELAKHSANETDQLKLSSLRTRRKRMKNDKNLPGQELGCIWLTKSQNEGKVKVT